MATRGSPLHPAIRQQIARLTKSGWSRRQTARQLGVAKRTVDKYAATSAGRRKSVAGEFSPPRDKVTSPRETGTIFSSARGLPPRCR